MRTALIIVDPQEDYRPGNPMGSRDSDTIIPVLVQLAGEVDTLIVARDLHPIDHITFRAQGGIWPEHCVKGTRGAWLHPAITDLEPEYVATKGQDRLEGGHSAFEAETLRPLRKVEDILKDEKITDVIVGGYLLEWAVAQTAFDANALGYKTTLKLSASQTWLAPGERQGDIVSRLEKAGVTVDD